MHIAHAVQTAASCDVQPGLLYATTENAMAAVAVAETTASATAAAAEAIPAAVVSTAVTTAVISSSAATKLLQLQSPQLPVATAINWLQNLARLQLMTAGCAACAYTSVNGEIFSGYNSTSKFYKSNSKGLRGNTIISKYNR